MSNYNQPTPTPALVLSAWVPPQIDHTSAYFSFYRDIVEHCYRFSVVEDHNHLHMELDLINPALCGLYDCVVDSPSIYDCENAASGLDSHYTQLSLQPLSVISAWARPARGGFNFYFGSFLKYVARHPYKGSPADDLRKALVYIELMRANVSDCIYYSV